MKPSRLNSGLGLSIATLLAIIATLAINTLSNIIPPGGQTVGEIANTTLDGVLITPANYAFVIWGVIYVGLIAYGLYQLGAAQRRDPALRQVNRWLITACLAQIVWIFLFTSQWFGASTVAMAVIWLALMVSYLNLDIGVGRSSWRRRWFAQVPISIYFAWITVATIVNVACALYAAGYTAAAVPWTGIMLGVSALIGALVAWQRRDAAFTLVLVWAYGAIAVRHGDITGIWLVAVIAAIFVLVTLAWSRYRRQPQPNSSPRP
ncbi:hypothetical protein XM38_021810 [Halomicronema hongdechloris C2206]|uniref:Tryptophan-rich sensory protein n=1 Tax=Halomicronema hongdechloris C2206 TaxID=1641165 RepID=A0A1Z3HLM9_9CYAN|nr:tryptophan-rich sensory protein [Halomicronema hongdechloris]ASC71229.1 hypothetical protein XM38_021810 [Halomicronema hongdechloris C2206]